MLRRPALSLLLVAGLALTAAACGGGGSPSSSTTGTKAASGDSNAQAVLASIRTNVGDQGPQQIAVKFSATINGTPTDPTLGAFLSKPISLTLDGPVDTKDKKSDLTFELAAGPIKVDGGIREVGADSFLQVNGKWYALPANALSSVTGASSGSTTSTTSTTTPSVSPQSLLAAFGDPRKLLSNAKLAGTDTIGGIKSDHVTGDIDLAALVRGISAASKGAGSTASPVSPAQIGQAVKELQQYVKSASADIWVGQSDHQIHRFATTIDGTTDSSTKASSGIAGFKITLDISATPTSAPSVSAPSSPAPLAQLEQDLGGLLGGLAGAGGTTTG